MNECFDRFAECASAGAYAHYVFPITMYKLKMPQNDWFKRSYVDRITETVGAPDMRPTTWLTNNVHTSFKNDEINTFVFKDEFPSHRYFDALNSVFDDCWTAKLQGYWFNFYADGEWQEKHTHVSDQGHWTPHLSCIHFLQFDPLRHRPPTFYDPCMNLKGSAFNVHSWSTPFTCEPSISEGDLLVFPPYLEHAVQPSEPTPDYPRITISFNLQLTSYGPKESQ